MTIEKYFNQYDLGNPSYLFIVDLKKHENIRVQKFLIDEGYTWSGSQIKDQIQHTDQPVLGVMNNKSIAYASRRRTVDNVKGPYDKVFTFKQFEATFMNKVFNKIAKNYSI